MVSGEETFSDFACFRCVQDFKSCRRGRVNELIFHARLMVQFQVIFMVSVTVVRVARGRHETIEIRYLFCWD